MKEEEFFEKLDNKLNMILILLKGIKEESKTPEIPAPKSIITPKKPAEYEDYEMYVFSETQKAIYVEYKEQKFWIPKSLIAGEVTEMEMEQVISIQSWFIPKKFEQENVDF